MSKQKELATLGEFFVYAGDDGRPRAQVRMVDGTIWLTQRQLGAVYDKDVRTISEHVRNILDEGELDPAATIRKLRTVQSERTRTGFREVTRLVDHYGLPMILAVGYRVRSHQGTRFRQWATALLEEYARKGFVMDDERLGAGKGPGADYFDELLERIRRIRASERRFYQKLTDIYAQCSIDYDPDADLTLTFYATVQNKLHWAIHGHTAAEVIHERADAEQPHMGLTTWKAGPCGPIRKSDVVIAKNYLTLEEVSALDRIVTMYLDHAEDQARRRKPMTMADWIAKLDAFLAFNERNILTHAGAISHDLAAAHAEAEYEKYDTEQRRLEASVPTSDFDRLVDATVEDLAELPRRRPKPSTER